MQKRSEAALVALRRILRATEFNARSIARASGLTPSQILTLQFLSSRDEATPTEIAAHASLKQATITSLLDKLEERKFIKRRRDEKDGRRVFIKLTAAGAKALSASPDALQQRFEERFERLADWEQAAIIASLERVAFLLGAEDIEAGPILDIGALDEVPQKAED
jgi:DNA-binding MarR family transcriptional regulator